MALLLLLLFKLVYWKTKLETETETETRNSNQNQKSENINQAKLLTLLARSSFLDFFQPNFFYFHSKQPLQIGYYRGREGWAEVDCTELDQLNQTMPN